MTTTENGFVDPQNTTIEFTDATRTFSLGALGDTQCSWTTGGSQWGLSGPRRLTVQIPDTEGLHFIYIDEETMVTTQTFSPTILTDYVFVAAVYWDATANASLMLMDERHSNQMDGLTHWYNHATFGARYESGFALGNMTVGGNGSAAAHAQFSVADGAFWDEDIRHVVTDGAPQDLSTVAKLPVAYRLGTTAWKLSTANDYPIITTGTGRIAYNLDTGGTWSLAEVASTNYGFIHVVATPDLRHPIISILGQGTYATKPAAETAAATELERMAFGSLAGLTAEFIPIATVLFLTNTSYSNAVKAAIQATSASTNYVDHRGQPARWTG